MVTFFARAQSRLQSIEKIRLGKYEEYVQKRVETRL